MQDHGDLTRDKTMTSPFRRSLTLATVAAAIGFALPALAQSVPSRPIILVVPFAAGGGTDSIARDMAKLMQEKFGQPVLVEHKPGASGALAARQVAKARGDGCTMLLGQTGQTGQMAVNRSAIAHATKTDMLHVPYKGACQAITDQLGGQVPFCFSSASAIMTHIKSGKVNAIADTSTRRLPVLPNVPTIAETAVPDFEFGLWGGYFAPRETPDAIVNRLHNEIAKMLTDADLRSRFESEGSAVASMSLAPIEAFVRTGPEMYAGRVKLTGAQND